MSKAKNPASNNSSEETTSAETSEAKASATKHSFSCPEDYSPTSQIARAYSNGIFPVAHKILFNSICKALDDKSEGNIDFQSVLDDAHMHRSSALNILKHMSAWGVLEVSFNSSQVIGQKRKSWAFVKILRNPEAQELPKSA